MIRSKSASVVFDCSKLKKLVPNYCATTRFDIGVGRCIDYILHHPEEQIEDAEFDSWCDRVIEAQEAAKNQLLHL